MNIIEAREAALAGKTVISPEGVTLMHYGFDDMEMIKKEWVFGEWSTKQEPVTFAWDVVESAMRPGHGRLDPLDCKHLQQFIGKKVSVTVEVIE